MQIRHLPEGVTSHLAQNPEMMALLSAFGPAGLHPVAWVALSAGALVTVAVIMGISESISLPVPAPGEESPPGSLPVVALVVLCALGPVAAFFLIPMSDLLVDLYLGELPLAYGLLAAGVGAVFVCGQVVLRVPLRVHRHPSALVVVGAVIFLGALALVRPLGPLRNLVILVPAVALLTVGSVGRLGSRATGICLGVAILFASLSLPHLGESFAPRPDLRGAAAGVPARATVVVWPRWDAPGIAYHGISEPVGVLTEEDLPAPAGDAWEVVLTRETLGDRATYEGALARHLGSGWTLEKTWSGRGVQRLSFRRIVGSPTNP